MKIDIILSILRNPWGRTEEEKKEARLAAADKIEELWDAYVNMKKFAEDSGLDTVTKKQPIGRHKEGKMKSEIKKHPDTIAWEKWIKSSEGKMCLNELPTAIQYLENRLYHAFMAGRKK